jgi:hypothetical protein
MCPFASTPFIRSGKRLNVLACLFAFFFIFSLGLPDVADAFFWTKKTEQSTEESPSRNEPLKTDAASDLPAGFIALSDTEMPWAEAKAWCAARGGRLPLINGANALSNVDDTAIIDGFGKVGTAWSPIGLPRGYYWSGTEYSDYPGFSWSVNGYGGGAYFNVYNDDKGFASRVACVP